MLCLFLSDPGPVPSCIFLFCLLSEPVPSCFFAARQGILFTAVVLCMDDDLLVPPSDAMVGELVTVKGHPATPSKNSTAVSIVWEKVLNEELFQVGDDEVRVKRGHKKKILSGQASARVVTVRGDDFLELCRRGLSWDVKYFYTATADVIPKN